MSIYPYISNVKCKKCNGDIIIKEVETSLMNFVAHLVLVNLDVKKWKK